MKSHWALLWVLLFSSVALAQTSANLDYVLDIADPVHVMLGWLGASPLEIDGFSITSRGGVFTPLSQATQIVLFNDGWTSVLQNTASECTIFHQMPGSGELETDVWYPGFAFDLGPFVPAGMSLAEAQSDITLMGMSRDGEINGVVIPEPASMSILALGVLALVRRRR